MLTHLDEQLWFPDPRQANPGGILAIGGDLSVPRLLLAYRSGVFPWSVNPITWWSPNPRAIFEFERFRAPRSLRKTVRRGTFEISADCVFHRVMEGCASGRLEGNWITPEFIEAYTQLHKAGHAHSLECWQSGQLAGGIYGVAIGGFFAGESMFHRAGDASKVALYHLLQRLRTRGFALFDIQMLTPITERLGAVTISRDEYLKRLETALHLPATFGPAGPCLA